ncbi:hypothetical protein FBQ99_22780 [Chloroflexi bacterium CFX2]|nr:hypothetical protein [Chloroflexi bacterium CFX2]
MKQVKILSIVAVVAALLMGTVYIASAGGNKNPGVLPPNSRVQGLTYGEWSARWWQYVLSIPGEENPLTGGTGTNCVYQRIGNVGLVAVDPLSESTITCQVPTGMMLFLDVLSAECSTVEEDPFYGGNEEEMRACALSFTISDLQASIDGSEVKNLDQYIHTSPLFDFTLPEDNILYTDELTGQSVSNGAHLMLAPLSPGEHVVYLHASIPELDFTVDMNIEFIVTR